MSTEKAGPVRVAEQWGLVAGANAAKAHELNEIALGGPGLGRATVERLAAPVDRMRPAAAAGTSPAGVDRATSPAGVRDRQRAGAHR